MHIYCVVLSTVPMCCGPGLDIQYLKLTAACEHKYQNQFTMAVLIIHTHSPTQNIDPVMNFWIQKLYQSLMFLFE